MHPLRFYACLTWEVLKIVRHPHKSINNYRTKRKIKNRRHGFLDQPFGTGHRVVPPTFHKIRVYAIIIWETRQFFKKVLISQEYLVPHFRLKFCRILLLLSFQKIYTFTGFTSNSCALRLLKASRDLPVDDTLREKGLGLHSGAVTVGSTKRWKVSSTYDSSIASPNSFALSLTKASFASIPLEVEVLFVGLKLRLRQSHFRRRHDQGYHQLQHRHHHNYQHYYRDRHYHQHPYHHHYYHHHHIVVVAVIIIIIITIITTIITIVILVIVITNIITIIIIAIVTIVTISSNTIIITIITTTIIIIIITYCMVVVVIILSIINKVLQYDYLDTSPSSSPDADLPSFGTVVVGLPLRITLRDT